MVATLRPWQERVLLADPEANREEWTRIRHERRGIGASTALDCLGLTDRSPLDAWMSITGKNDPTPDNQRLKAGRRFERAIAEWGVDELRENGYSTLELLPSPGLIEHYEFPWLLGTPDFLLAHRDPAPGTNHRLCILEVKNRDRSAKDEWLAEPPLREMTQLQLYLDIMGLEEGAFAVCFGGNEVLPIWQVKNEVYLHEVKGALADWYERHVVGDTPPPATATERDRALWRRLHPKDNGQRVILSAAAERAHEEFERVKAELKELEAKKLLLQAQIESEIGDATFGVLSDGSGYSFKTSTIHYKAKEERFVDQRTLRWVKRV